MLNTAETREKNKVKKIKTEGKNDVNVFKNHLN